jgi:indolepyruvate decarboxylase
VRATHTESNRTTGRGVERLLSRNPDSAYNDVAAWHYAELPHALGCDGWFTARVSTCGELDQALQQAGQNTSGAYIQVVTDEYTTPPLAQKLHDNLATPYAS